MRRIICNTHTGAYCTGVQSGKSCMICHTMPLQSHPILFTLCSHYLNAIYWDFYTLRLQYHRRGYHSIGACGLCRDTWSLSSVRNPSCFEISVQRRFVRTGFFRNDEDFIDPQKVLLAKSAADEWNHAGGCGDLSEPVLERNNIGMGILIVNKERASSDLIFTLYRGLRDLEVNPLKKFCCITSRHRGLFSRGIDQTELLAYAEHAQLNDRIVPACALWHIHALQNTAYLLHNFRKPLVGFLNGRADDDGACISLLTNRSTAYFHSTYTCDPTAYGFVPFMGTSFLLGSLRGSLGAFLCLTGHALHGADVFWSGLCRHWMSPEALPFLELTSEKQLEVSEQDAKFLLEEHYLRPPGLYTLDEWEGVIDQHFSQPDIQSIYMALDHTVNNGFRNEGHFIAPKPEAVRAWAKDTKARMRRRAPLAQALSLEIIRRVQAERDAILIEANISPNEWRTYQLQRRFVASSVRLDSIKQIVEAVDSSLLEYALQQEMRVVLRLIATSSELFTGLRTHLSGVKHEESAENSVELQSLPNYFAPLPAPSEDIQDNSIYGNKYYGGAVSAPLSNTSLNADIRIRSDPWMLIRKSEFTADNCRSSFPFSSHPIFGRVVPGGSNLGMSERQQLRLSKFWNIRSFRQLKLQEI